MGLPMTAQAGIVQTDEIVSDAAASANRDKVTTFLARQRRQQRAAGARTRQRRSQAATAQHADFADAWNNLAQVQLELRRLAPAQQAINTAVELGGARLPRYLKLQPEIAGASQGKSAPSPDAAQRCLTSMWISLRRLLGSVHGGL